MIKWQTLWCFIGIVACLKSYLHLNCRILKQNNVIYHRNFFYISFKDLSMPHCVRQKYKKSPFTYESVIPITKSNASHGYTIHLNNSAKYWQIYKWISLYVCTFVYYVTVFVFCELLRWWLHLRQFRHTVLLVITSYYHTLVMCILWKNLSSMTFLCDKILLHFPYASSLFCFPSFWE